MQTASSAPLSVAQTPLEASPPRNTTPQTGEVVVAALPHKPVTPPASTHAKNEKALQAALERARLAEKRAAEAEAAVEGLAEALKRAVFIANHGFVPEDADEPLLNEEALSKYVVTSEERPAGPSGETIQALYKELVATFWTTEELDLATDKREWDSGKIEEKVKHFILRTLGFFLGSEGVVIENAASNLLRCVQWGDFRNFYAMQLGNEAIHAETYSIMVENLVTDPVEKECILNSIKHHPAVAEKTRWAERWMRGKPVTGLAADILRAAAGEKEDGGDGAVFHEPARFGELILAFGCVEAIFFSASFCAIHFMRRKGLMHGLCDANELISRDEGTHCRAARCAMDFVKHKPSQAKAEEIVRSAVEAEDLFTRDALPWDLEGMNAKLMLRYVQFVADNQVLVPMGYKPIFRVANPFPWMDMIMQKMKGNFFERRVVEYAKATAAKGGFAFTDDF